MLVQLETPSREKEVLLMGTLLKSGRSVDNPDKASKHVSDVYHSFSPFYRQSRAIVMASTRAA
jgi:hypothetical protein